MEIKHSQAAVVQLNILLHIKLFYFASDHPTCCNLINPYHIKPHEFCCPQNLFEKPKRVLCSHDQVCRCSSEHQRMKRLTPCLPQDEDTRSGLLPMYATPCSWLWHQPDSYSTCAANQTYILGLANPHQSACKCKYSCKENFLEDVFTVKKQTVNIMVAAVTSQSQQFIHTAKVEEAWWEKDIVDYHLLFEYLYQRKRGKSNVTYISIS